jgi:hypothetical protein
MSFCANRFLTICLKETGRAGRKGCRSPGGGVLINRRSLQITQTHGNLNFNFSDLTNSVGFGQRLILRFSRGKPLFFRVFPKCTDLDRIYRVLEMVRDHSRTGRLYLPLQKQGVWAVCTIVRTIVFCRLFGPL